MSDPDQNIPFKKSHKYWFYNENTIEIRTRKGLLSMVFYGAPEGIRTPDLLIRSQTLYPAELRAQVSIDDLLPAIADNVCYYTAKCGECQEEISDPANFFLPFIFCRRSFVIRRIRTVAVSHARGKRRHPVCGS